MKRFPRAVSSYSTRGGTSGNTSRISSPSRSRLRKVAVNIRCEIPGMARFSSEKRARCVGFCSSMAITRRLHLSPTRSSISRNSQS